MFASKKLALAVRYAVYGLTAASTLAISANAEEATESETAKKAERIQVTGSRIKRSDMETASPVAIIDASAIVSSGAGSIGELLQDLPAAGGAVLNPGINNGSQGGSSVNLRGLGAERTLVLVNGRRMIASGTNAASTVDLNTIPVSMIERIEVLKDGASAIYGTDAVSGVVNVILKRNFEGFKVNVQHGQSSKKDAEESAIDLTFGTSSDKGNIVFGIQYTDRRDAKQGERYFSRCPIDELDHDNDKGEKTLPKGLFCAGSVFSEGGHIYGDASFGLRKLQDGEKYVIGDKGKYGKYVADPEGGADAVFKAFTEEDAANGEFVYQDVSGRGGQYHDFSDADRFDYAKDSYLYTPMQRISLTTSTNYELADNLSVYAEAMYTKRWSVQQMAPQPVQVQDSTPYDPIRAGDANGDGSIAAGETIGWMNPELTQWFDVGEELNYYRRAVESGTRNFKQTVDTVRVVFGLEGELSNGWLWDIAYNKGRNDSVNSVENLHNMGAIQSAVTAKEFDPLLQKSWSKEGLSKYTYTEINSGGSEMDLFSASISGDLYDLPAGVLGFAAGYEHRLESAFFIPDSLKGQGLANDPAVEPTRGSFKVDEAYAEFAIPLVSEIFLVDHLELSAAARFFDYSTFGSDYTWKLGLTWQVSDDLMLRGVRSTAFRAPTVDELYGGAATSFDRVDHPATAQDQAEVTVGGYTELQPEEANILTLGAVYEPSFVDGLSMTIDYYDIDLTDTIDTVSSQYIANTCLDKSGQRINQGLQLCQAASVSIDGGGRISLNNTLLNLGELNTSGVDLNVSYGFNALGLSWKANADASWLRKYDLFDQDGNKSDYKGMSVAKNGGYADWKSNASLTASSDDWEATYSMRYIDGLESLSCKGGNPYDCLVPETGSVVYHDVFGSWYATDTVSFSAGINNLFDKTAPYYSKNEDANTNPYVYDVIGRYMFVRASLQF